ncbi:MAG: hypothetical protein KA956_01075 [Pyrinomonadaceae bacterium]|nr:hypothetical protein [Acidobacteriota bacterium]MBK7933597.1 hypothetical protein [Acidobacteriota bacterium]MBP7375046.1 hypothetical protein [Pyrinomonadaceae bacterium]
MNKEVIHVDGKDVLVREDSAKAFRFTRWGLVTAAIGLAIMFILMWAFFIRAGSDGKIDTPAQIANSNANTGK